MQLDKFIVKLNNIENPKTEEDKMKFLSDQAILRREELDEKYKKKQDEILEKLRQNVANMNTKKLLREVNDMSLVMKSLGE